METSLETLVDLLTRPQFQAGLLAGLAAWIVIQTFSPRGRGWGIALSAATILGVNITVDRRLSTTVGLALLAIGGFLLDRNRAESDPGPAPWILIAVGAVMATLRGGLPGTLWVQFAAPTVIIFFGYWISAWNELPQRRIAGPLVFITAFGIWSTVPDTESARVLTGAVIPLSLATVSARGMRLSTAGALPLAGILVWVAATGGEARHASIIGAWACVGLLVLLPLLGEMARRLPEWLVIGVHALFILVSSRVFGLWETAFPATIGVAVVAGIVYVGLGVGASQLQASRQV